MTLTTVTTMGSSAQVRGFPLLLQEALKSAKAEVSAGSWVVGPGEALEPLGGHSIPHHALPKLRQSPQTAAPFPTTHTWLSSDHCSV